MNKKIRQYLGLLSAVLVYYLVHEGAHLVYALFIGVFRQINFMGVGVQVDVHAQQMSHLQMGVFCLIGAVATTIVAYVLTLAAPQICKSTSKVFKACMYYITLIMLLLAPLYLSVLCGFFGGGDMNGIALLLPEVAARILFGVLLLINGLVFWKMILPKYKMVFSKIQSFTEDLNMKYKSIHEIISTVFKALTLAMGVAVVVLSCLDSLEMQTAVTMLGIGLACAGVALLENGKEK